jgi:protein phosphatase
MCGKVLVSAKTDIGLRDRQEDRFLVTPSLLNQETEDGLFLGVFDGTVGDAASQFVQTHILEHLMATKGFQELQRLQETSDIDRLTLERRAAFVHSALYDTYFNTDAALLEECAQTQNHYAASTSVTAFLSGPLLSIAHVADSKACLARLSPSRDAMVVEWLTQDHKPNDPRELRRIESQGGSLVYLHEGKPYIRGGDFHSRQKRGERPKQLNYSRAFGGKDLKNFGLSVEPAITHFKLSPLDRLLIIGSDGLWDVFDHRTAVSIALQAMERGEDAAEQLVNQAIRFMPSRNVRDNITVIVCQLNAFLEEEDEEDREGTTSSRSSEEEREEDMVEENSNSFGSMLHPQDTSASRVVNPDLRSTYERQEGGENGQEQKHEEEDCQTTRQPTNPSEPQVQSHGEHDHIVEIKSEERKEC